MKKTIFRFGWLIVVAGVIGAMVAYSKLQPVAVQTAVVRTGRIEEVVEEEARTQLHEERIVAAEIPGTAARVALEVGDLVKKGQPITTIEDKDLRIERDLIGATLAEIRAHLAGADVTLPKPAQIQAAEKDAVRAAEQVRALKADMHGADATRRFAEKEFARIQELAVKNVATPRQLEEAQHNRDVAVANRAALDCRINSGVAAEAVARLHVNVLKDSLQDTAHLHKVYDARIKQTEQQLALLDRRIAKTVIASPIDGVVLEKYLDSEQFVQPGAPLVRVGIAGSIEIRADILSDQIAEIAVGQSVRLIGPAVEHLPPTGHVAATVKQVYPSGFTKISSLGVRQQRVPVLIDFDNSVLRLLPGAELDVRVTVQSKDAALLVPSDAVFSTAHGQAVFVVANGKAELRPIETGLSGLDDYEVLSGLSDGDVVVLRPPSQLEPGRRVVQEQE
jgi:HlyD family secretion protein